MESFTQRAFPFTFDTQEYLKLDGDSIRKQSVVKVLVTGASGFVGSALSRYLSLSESYDVVGAVRLGAKSLSEFPMESRYCDLSDDDASNVNFEDIDVVIHTAARVHQMDDRSEDPLEEFMKINCDGTLNLAKQAVKAGVKRFIFLSSIKVNGEKTQPGKSFRYDDLHKSEDHYGKSKSEAELGLLKIASESKLEVCIIRPPLVYGPGVKANFSALLKLASKNFPVPFGSIQNKKSFVAIDNLVSLIVTCIDHPNAINQVFLVSDDQDISTSKLYSIMTNAYGKKARLIKVNTLLLKRAFGLIGKGPMIDRLCDDLRVDIEHTKVSLDWTPVVSTDDGVKLCVFPVNSNKHKLV